MKEKLLEILRCPSCGGRLALEAQASAGDEIETGTLRCNCGREYPIAGGIPRFVPASNYANSFGLQWNRFRRTQLDSHSGHPISARRFARQTGWSAEDVAGRLVLDAGCGAGRFAEIALGLGANLVAIDYSSAVDACRANHGHNERLNVVQADIYALPFAPESFDLVYSLGVLQHTPDVHRAVRSLVPPLRRGGRLTIDFYLKRWLNFFDPKYWLRPITTRMRAETLFRIVERAVPSLLAIRGAVRRVPLVGRYLARVVPVADYRGVLPLSDAQLREWAVLDTFDWLSPAYDNPQTAATLRRWMTDERLTNVDVFRSDHLTARAMKPTND